MTVKNYIDTGLKLAAKGEYREAALAFCRAIKLNPGLAEAHQRLGEVLLPLGYSDDAAACFFKAIEIQPHYPEAYNHLGAVLKGKNRPAEAEDAFRQAVEQKPDYPEAFYNLGNCLKIVNRLEEAEECYLRALELQPGLDRARFSLATLYLLQGKYDKGWEMYESRFIWQGKFRLDIPLWQGEALTGRKILLFYEQGLGDSIQFARYAYKIAEMAQETTVWIQQPLYRLLNCSQQVFSLCTKASEIMPGQFDFACSLMSLPAVFHRTGNSQYSFAPYLRADEKTAAKWRKKINKLAGPNLQKIGVVWAGNPEHSNDLNRSVPWEEFSRLFEEDEIVWASLQMGEQARHLRGMRDKVLDCAHGLADFAETAGVIENLDLVITVDTAVAHLAGAMGKKTWLLLPFAPDWRWELRREDTLWYPAMRLYRQSRTGDWQEVLGRVAEDLRRMAYK